jgi:hypothetical protein
MIDLLPQDIVPVFIGGCDRSGTTFLASMIGNSDSAIVTPESQFKVDFLNCKSNKFYSSVMWRLKVWSIPSERLNEIFKDSADGKALMLALILEYARIFKNNKPRFWIDHTPTNFQNFKMLSQQYPNAKFIHIIRDGRAVASSVMPLAWGPSNANDAAMWWLTKISFGLAAQLSAPEKVITVKYEDILENPETELERVCNFIGIPYNNNMLLGRGFTVPKYTKNQHYSVGQLPDKSKVDIWKSNLCKRDVEIFEYHSSGMLDTLGYDVMCHKPSAVTKRERFLFFLKFVFLEYPRQVIRRKMRLYQ